jgi:D-lactate dehydrogenase
MKAVFFEVEEWEKPYLIEKLPDFDLTFYPESLSKDTIDTTKDADIISVFIYSQLTKELIDQLPQTKLIVTRSTGYDHIDIAYCTEKNILVCNVPEYGTHTVAEHTFALLLAISRKLLPSIERARKGDFSLDGLRGFDLFEKTIGVIGVGHIGQTVIKIAKGFGMQAIGYSHQPDDILANALGFSFVELDELLMKADIISLHVPYNSETHHFLNKERIQKCKKGVVILNTALGGLIDTEALLMGFEQGIVKAAGIDVLEEECYVKEERQLLTEQFLK